MKEKNENRIEEHDWELAHFFLVELQGNVRCLGNELHRRNVEISRHRHVHAHRVLVLIPPEPLRRAVVVYLRGGDTDGHEH